uniref:WASH_WAHD domain-containing protein n=1 Tax=Macrostomum lignano TaxID=282301 RepID=A0A1I8FAT7_9PLAT
PAIQCQLRPLQVRPPSADLRHEELLVQSADSLAEVAGCLRSRNFPPEATRRQLFCRPSRRKARALPRLLQWGRVQTAVRRVAAQHEALTEALLAEKRHYMMLPLRPPGAKRAAAAEGLGRPPPGLRSLSGLLLFNTAENPYR